MVNEKRAVEMVRLMLDDDGWKVGKILVDEVPVEIAGLQMDRA